MRVLTRLARQREFVVFLIVLVVIIVMTIVSPIFLTKGNMLALLLSLSTDSIIAIGMALLLVSGAFDLSVGSLLGFVGVMVAIILKSGVPTVPAVIIAIIIGSTVGLFNGFIVAKLKINAFITTLATLNILRGITFAITKGKNIALLPDSFNAIGQTRVGGAQLPVFYALILIIIGDILLRNSRFFRQSYFIGGNEKAARLSGINVDRVLILNYVIIALLTSIAAIIFTSRLGAASTQSGTGLELRVITAVILGGASLKGGSGSILGAFLGVFLMALIYNSLILLGVDIYWQQFVVGTVLIIAVIIDTFGRSDRLKLKRTRKAV